MTCYSGDNTQMYNLHRQDVRRPLRLILRNWVSACGPCTTLQGHFRPMRQPLQDDAVARQHDDRYRDYIRKALATLEAGLVEKTKQEAVKKAQQAVLAGMTKKQHRAWEAVMALQQRLTATRKKVHEFCQRLTHRDY